jgi:hypothetical protein
MSPPEASPGAVAGGEVGREARRRTTPRGGRRERVELDGRLTGGRLLCVL